MKISYKIMIVAALLLTGCGNFNSVHRVLEVSRGEGALIDIKQRAIISSVVTTVDGNKEIKRIETKVCAEPSPDALSAYAAELAAKADTGKIGAAFTSAFQEGASFVGLRTQSIQLLRDASYRLCESYLSGATTAEEYSWLLRRFQRNMVVLLAVEQLTGAIRAPSVTVNMGGQAEAAKSLSEISSEKEKIDAQVKKLESETKADEIEKNKEKLARLKQDSKSMNDALSNARNLLAGGSATARIGDVNIPLQPTTEHITVVARTVESMVNNITNQDDKGQLCYFYLRSLENVPADSKPRTKLEVMCNQYFSNPNSGGIHMDMHEQ